MEVTVVALRIPEHAQWARLVERVAQVAPDGFAGDRLRNLYEGQWQDGGERSPMISPVDQSTIGQLSKIDEPTALKAVSAAHQQHRDWAEVSLTERKARVTAAVDAMTETRDDLALLLAWEIGKPWKLACADVDRALDGVRWYLENIDGMLSVDAAGRHFDRGPLPGPVSNIASWNYPMSVLVHAELVQLLAGNAVVAKTPTQGGAFCLTVAHALMDDAGLPVTLLSGDGSKLSGALVRSMEIGALAFVGGRDNGGKVAAQLVDTGKRHMLEQEGLNCWGIWEFSDWDGLAKHLKKGFEYAKQRCTAYPRFVVQRDLVDSFLATYLPVVQSINFGHPLAVDSGAKRPELPVLDFGPMISAAKARDLGKRVDEALRHGAVPLYRGSLDQGRFLPGQDTSAYVA